MKFILQRDYICLRRLLVFGGLLTVLGSTPLLAQESTIFLDGSAVPPLYQGYDSKTGKLKAAVCVADAGGAPSRFASRKSFSSGPSPDVNGTPQLVNYSVSHIQDSQSLQSTLSLSASASFNIGYGSGSASYNYFSQSNFSSYSEYLAVEVNVENQTTTHPNVKYTNAAQKLIDKKDYVGFYRLCGDSFIEGKVSGGYFLAIAKFDTQSSSDQVSTSADLQATVGSYGSTSDKMSSNVQKLASHTNVNVQILRKAPSASVDDSIGGIIKYAQDFPNAVANANAYVTKIVLSEYPGDPVASIPATQAATIDRLARTLGKAYQRKSNLKYAAAHMDQFPQITLAEMSTNQSQIDDLITAVKVAGNQCEASATNCKIATYPAVPELPARAEWVKLADADAQACPPEKITDTTRNSDMSIEMHGSWTAWSSGVTWLGVNQSNIYLQDHDGLKAPIVITPVADVLYKVPAYNVVKFMVGDGPTCAQFADNRVNPDAPLSWRMFDENPIARVSFGSLPHVGRASTLQKSGEIKGSKANSEPAPK